MADDLKLEDLLCQFYKIFGSFYWVLRLAALRLERIYGTDPAGLPGPALDAIGDQCLGIMNEIILEKEHPFQATVTKMVTYLRIYNVEQKSIDPIKVSYWFCESVIDHYSSLVSHAGKIVRLALTIQMRKMMRLDIKKTLDSMMERKIEQNLLADQKEEIFGKYGLYMIYENCARLCYSHPCALS